MWFCGEAIEFLVCCCGKNTKQEVYPLNTFLSTQYTIVNHRHYFALIFRTYLSCICPNSFNCVHWICALFHTSVIPQNIYLGKRCHAGRDFDQHTVWCFSAACHTAHQGVQPLKIYVIKCPQCAIPSPVCEILLWYNCSANTGLSRLCDVVGRDHRD
jgi:hypothetical protein